MAAEQHYGKGVDALFKSAPVVPAPFPRAGRRKDVSDYDPDIVGKAIGEGKLQEIDPRTLSAHQPSVTLEGVRHYAEDRAGNFADGHKYGNEHPVVYQREGTNVLLSGTHRATAALVQGKPLKAIVTQGPWGAARKKS